MKKYVYILLFVMSVAGCKKEEMETYAGLNYIQFVDSYADSTTLSFFFYPGQSELSYPLEVKLLGFMKEEQVHYKLKVVEEETTATPDLYDIPEAQVLQAGKVTDMAKITFKKAEKLNTKAFRIVVDVVNSDDALAGEMLYCRKVFWISNMIAQPEWWDANIVKSFLGVYSDLKFEEFIKVAETGDLSDKSSDEKRALVLKFKYYLQKRIDDGDPVKEADGSIMTVPILG